MKITVYLGTGGVGKTSVAAATALAQARAGARTLVLTTDPSYRLRTALGLAGDALEQAVPLDPPPKAELWGALLDVRTTLDEAVRLYGKPDKVGPILRHPIYATIADSLVGMQELMAVERIDQLMRRGFDNIVVDTAPSRHALEFLDKPVLFAELAHSGVVKLAGRTYRFAVASPIGLFSKATLKIYAQIESILGARLVSQILDFYSLFFAIAEGYAQRARRTVKLLKNRRITEFRIVTTPQKSLRDAAYFIDELTRRGFPVGAICVNRVWGHRPGAGRPEGLEGELLEWYGSVRDFHQRALDQLRRQLGDRVPAVIEVPELELDVGGLDSLEQIAASAALARL
jgi:anion-transporting  ArsA/GET3 family ATPase